MRHTFMALAIACMLGLAACGGSSTNSGSTTGAGAATITMGTGQFTGNTSVTIKAGQTVTFDDSSGGPHNLVTGMNGTFSQEQGAPADFVPGGISFTGGKVLTITFANAGTYQITCTFHPSMQATVTVTA